MIASPARPMPPVILTDPYLTAELDRVLEAALSHAGACNACLATLPVSEAQLPAFLIRWSPCPRHRELAARLREAATDLLPGAWEWEPVEGGRSRRGGCRGPYRTKVA